MKDYIKRRKKLSGLLFEVALPNEYLVEVGRRDVKPILGGKKLRLFRKYLRVPASVQTLYFTTDNANMDYQGIGIDGYASWRVDSAHPEVAIQTLDFFDEDDPMALTNDELKTICVEAVRHVISNMSIDDALRKKDEIATNLKQQLAEVEKKWGIIFDQVGIENVRIMSSKLFEQLQAQFRDGLRLEVERKRLTTDREIARETNAVREKNQLETLETDKKLNLARVEGTAQVQEGEINEKFRLGQKQRELDTASFRSELQFRTEKEEKEHALTMLERQLEISRLDQERTLLETKLAVETVRQSIERQEISLLELRRQVEQTWSGPALTQEFLSRLPEIYQSLKIQNWSVLAGGESGVSPVGQVLAELAAIVKSSDLASLFQPKPPAKPE